MKETICKHCWEFFKPIHEGEACPTCQRRIDNPGKFYLFKVGFSMKRTAMLFLATLVVTPIIGSDFIFFTAGTILRQLNGKESNIFLRVSDFICDRLERPWFRLFGLWEDTDPCS
jgi:hypothetical protein